MRKLVTVVIACFLLTGIACAQSVKSVQSVVQTPCGPVPTENQLRWQDMEMYAFIHYSLNTYTDQEWGFGNEDPKLFNPSDLDCRQWARVCKQAGMRGIIFTAKHHCGFCMWPSKYTEYSVKNSPWKNGQGDVVRELADACREEGLKFAVYLSPWDRNHADYGRPEYVTYFRNQLRELLTNYGDCFEVWFDGANGGDGWYGGANETRKIDRTTYYEWPKTYKMIRELQPQCLIWNDGSDRGDLRWVGTEAGNVGETNWSLLNHDGEVTWPMLHYGLEDGDSWVPGETNTSIRPGWFYHKTEDEHVKSLSKLMDTYYKSVGRNSTLLLNFPIAPNGRIHPNDSLRGIAFNKMIQEVFKTDLAADADIQTKGMETTIAFNAPTTFNRFVAEEDIRYGQRVKEFSLEAFVDGQWIPLRDELVEGSDGLTTIGHRRIICFPTLTATRLRFTILDAKCDPIIKRISVYRAPELTADIPDSGEKRSSNLHYFFSSPQQMMIDWDTEQTITSFRYLPPQNTKDGTVTHYTLWASTDWANWTKIASGEFSNIVNNPIWQTIKFPPVKAKILRLDADRLAEGERMAFSDMEIILSELHEQMQTGKYEPTWESLETHQTPEWFRDAKFGIWAHWGPQCVEGSGDWMARGMYIEGNNQYKYHLEHYGHPSEFGFKDILPLFKAEKWDPETLVERYKRCGAKYFFVLGNHHDNYDLWDSKYQPWNSKNIGPKKDILDGWAKAAKKAGLPLGISFHADHAWLWYETAQRYDQNGPKAGVYYDGKLTKEDGKGKWWEGYDPQMLYRQNHPMSDRSWSNVAIHWQWGWENGACPPSEDFVNNFYDRTLDAINRYQPDLIYFDVTVLPFYPLSDCGLKIATHLYNKNPRSVVFGKILNDKQKKALTWDVERGAPNAIMPDPWQTCNCIGDWHYNTSVYERGYRTAENLVKQLVDIVSKNGNLLLNIPLRADGTYDEKAAQFLDELEAWMTPNGESIFGTRPWVKFGEGPVAEKKIEINAQGFNEGQYNGMDYRDIRFNQTKKYLYATAMGWPADGQLVIKSLAKGNKDFRKSISSVWLLGYGKLKAKQTAEGLTVSLPQPCNRIAPVLRINK